MEAHGFHFLAAFIAYSQMRGRRACFHPLRFPQYLFEVILNYAMHDISSL